MTNTLRITRLSMALTVAAGLAACNDLSTSPHQVTTPIVAAPPRPSELPPPPAPTPTPQAATDDQPKLQPTAAKADEGDDDDQEIEPSQALAGARKPLAAGDREARSSWRSSGCGGPPSAPTPGTCWAGRSCRLGQRKDAIASFEKAVELNEQNSYAHNNLGLALIYDKQFEEAVDELEQAVELEPVEAYMWNNLGMAYEQLDRLEEARDAYSKAADMESGRARDSLTRLKGVKSVIRTAKVDAPLRLETPAPADDESKNGVGGQSDEKSARWRPRPSGDEEKTGRRPRAGATTPRRPFGHPRGCPAAPAALASLNGELAHRRIEVRGHRDVIARPRHHPVHDSACRVVERAPGSRQRRRRRVEVAGHRYVVAGAGHHPVHDPAGGVVERAPARRQRRHRRVEVGRHRYIVAGAGHHPAHHPRRRRSRACSRWPPAPSPTCRNTAAIDYVVAGSGHHPVHHAAGGVIRTCSPFKQCQPPTPTHPKRPPIDTSFPAPGTIRCTSSAGRVVQSVGAAARRRRRHPYRSSHRCQPFHLYPSRHPTMSRSRRPPLRSRRQESAHNGKDESSCPGADCGTGRRVNRRRAI